jgi:hypothetical protein
MTEVNSSFRSSENPNSGIAREAGSGIEQLDCEAVVLGIVLPTAVCPCRKLSTSANIRASDRTINQPYDNLPADDNPPHLFALAPYDL